MKTFYDTNQVRYTLAVSNGQGNTNWIFLPGGPGTDSCYFLDLLEVLSLPGNVWLLDLPGSGTNHALGDNFDTWFDIFLPILHGFSNPVLVGHSFGGMFPLLFPELEEILKGFVILNSAPVLWVEAAQDYAKQHCLPDFLDEMTECLQNPCQETFNTVMKQCIPYYFPKSSLSKGEDLFAKTPVAFKPCIWWFKKVLEIQYNAKWIPKDVETLIIGAEFDAITPFKLFDQDQRFVRANITKIFIKEAGHFPWVEKPSEVKNAFEIFIAKLA